MQKLFVPTEVFRPVEARNTVDGGIGVLTVTGFVPRLKTECRNAEFRPRKRFWCAQQVHPRGVQPDAGALFVWRGLQHRYFADPGAAQRERDRAARLSATHDGHVMIDARSIGYPIG